MLAERMRRMECREVESRIGEGTSPWSSQRAGPTPPSVRRRQANQTRDPDDPHRQRMTSFVCGQRVDMHERGRCCYRVVVRSCGSDCGNGREGGLIASERRPCVPFPARSGPSTEHIHPSTHTRDIHPQQLSHALGSIDERGVPGRRKDERALTLSSLGGRAKGRRRGRAEGRQRLTLATREPLANVLDPNELVLLV